MSTILSGSRPSAANIVSGRGLLLGFLVSHAQTTAQTLTFYDSLTASGTVLLTVYIAPEQNPRYLFFGRQNAISFATGLSYAAPNCELAVWTVQV